MKSPLSKCCCCGSYHAIPREEKKWCIPRQAYLVPSCPIIQRRFALSFSLGSEKRAYSSPRRESSLRLLHTVGVLYQGSFFLLCFIFSFLSIPSSQLAVFTRPGGPIKGLLPFLIGLLSVHSSLHQNPSDSCSSLRFLLLRSDLRLIIPGVV